MANPVQKVLELLSSLQAKVVKEGEASQSTFDEFTYWCENQSKDLKYAIENGKAQKEDLDATIAKAKSTIDAGNGKIEELTSKLQTLEGDLKDATDIREKEHEEFVVAERDLVDDVDALARAIQILERELEKGAAFVQMKSATNFAQALKVLVDASALSTQDATRLKAFVQSSEQSSEDDENDSRTMSNMMGAPDPAAYESQSGGIVGVLEDLSEKAKTELDAVRKTEMNSQHNYDMLKQSLDDEISDANKEMGEVKKRSSQAAETQATAEGDLAQTTKALDADMQEMSEVHQDCMIKAQDFEAENRSREEELAALAKAKKVLEGSTGGAAGQTYTLLQFSSSRSSLATHEDLANFETVMYLKKLAKQLRSPAISLLASKIASFMRLGGTDPFTKVKGLISEMIEKLLKEAEEDATQKGYCDKEMGETEAKKAELDTSIDDLSTKIDKMSADSAKLKEEVATLQKELADLASSQAEMDKLRQEEKDAYAKNKQEMEDGLEGVKIALKIIREFYGQNKGDASEGAASGIIGLLEVIESDFSKGLSELNTVENTAQAEYTKQTNENEISTTLKNQDVKYKTMEATKLDKSSAELNSDRKDEQSELDAVLEYYERLKAQCIAKPESYEERVKHREEEIAGLKEALEILSGDAVFLQRTTRNRKLRGIHLH